MNADPSAGTKQTTKDRILAESHLQLQRILVYVAAPLMVVAYGATMIRTGFPWQTVAVFLSAVGTTFAWLQGIRLTRQQKLEQAVYWLLGGLQLLVSVSMILTRGNGATTLAAHFIAILYSSLFSRRHLLVTSGITAAVFLFAELSWYTHIYEHLVLSEGESFYRGTLFFCIILPAFAYMCWSASQINARLIEQTEALSATHASSLRTVRELGSSLDEAIRRIDGVATSFSRQAGEQSAAIAEIGQTMGQLRALSSRSAETASHTHNAVVELRDNAGPGTSRLRAVEVGFEGVLRSNEVARREFEELTAMVEQVGGILNANREIAAQIKILAVNANVQAAKAGEFGAGFRVVATELKAMIQRTEAALGESRRLLEAILIRARNSAAAIDASTSLIVRHHSELKEATALIDRLISRFLETADGVQGLSASAYEQQFRLDEVGGNIAYIERAAAQLAESTEHLSDTVRHIDDAQSALVELLKEEQE